MKCTKNTTIQLALPIKCPVCKKGNITKCDCNFHTPTKHPFRSIEEYLGKVGTKRQSNRK